MPTKILRIAPRGFNRDAIPDGSFWSECEGMADRYGGMAFMAKDSTGYTSSPTNINVPLWGMYVREPDNVASGAQVDYWVTVGTDGSSGGEVMVSTGGTAKDITPVVFWAPGANDITGGVMNGQIFIAQGTTAPKTWDYDFAGPTVMASLTGWFASTAPQWIRAYRDFLVVGDVWDGTNRFNNEIRWSDRAAAGGLTLPTVWTASATNEAGSATLGDTPGKVTDGLALGDQFIIYKPESSYRMEEVGLPSVMGIRRGNSTEGVLSRNCVQVINNEHYVVGNGDIYKTDGRKSVSIIDGVMRGHFFDDLTKNSSKREMTYTAYNPKDKEFWVCYHSIGMAGTAYPNTALVFNGQHWGRRRIGLSGYSPSDGNQGFPYIFTGLHSSRNSVNADHRLLGIDPDATDDQYFITEIGGAIGQLTSAKAEVWGIQLAQGRRSVITRIWPILAGGSAVNVTLGTSHTPANIPTWGSAQSHNSSPLGVGTDDPITLRSEGRFHAIRVEEVVSATATDMRVIGFDIEYEELGRA